MYNFLTILISLAAFTISLITYYNKLTSDKRSNNEKTALIYERFSTDPVLEARGFIWYNVFRQYFQEDKFRRRLIYYSPEGMDIFSTIKRESEGQKQTDEQKARQLISNLIEFYAYIFRLFKDDYEALNAACNQFFYTWWRGFLLSYVLLSRQNWENWCVTDQMKARYPFHNNLAFILELDIRAMDHIFDPITDLLYSKDAGCISLYPGLEAHNRALERYQGRDLFMRRLHR